MVLSTTWQIWYMIWSSSHVPSIRSIYLIYSFGTYNGTCENIRGMRAVCFKLSYSYLPTFHIYPIKHFNNT